MNPGTAKLGSSSPGHPMRCPSAEMPPEQESSEVTGAGRFASKLVLSQAGKVMLGGPGRPQFLPT